MLRITCVAGLLTLVLPNPMLAQAAEGHVWAVNELRAHSGEEAAYTAALQEFDLPVMDEVIRMGAAVSRQLMVKRVGNMANGTHLLIIEWASWEDYINADQVLDEAARAIFGRPYAQVAAEEYVSMRDVIRREVYLDPPGRQ